jgi:TolB-like protein/DNA-binding winged helix-turn-helix (wHTH) protein/Flp pilus assembly protein TadD
MRTYRFGDFELDLDALQLRLHGQPVKLERRPLDLLILLVSRHGHMVPREDIIASLWPARVIIDFESGLNTLIRKVRNALGDHSDHPAFIETVQGRGYRFIAPVVEITASDPIPPPSPQPSTAPRWQSRSIATLLVSVVVAGIAMFGWLTFSVQREPTRIAVLPFENLTGDDTLAYLAAGLAEETSMSLSRIDLADVYVIGGMSTRVLADAGTSMQRLGRDAGVDYLVLSSLRLDRPRIRVGSRLIRVADGAQIWSASFDRELTNVLGLQRELSIAIAEQIRQRLSPDVAAAIDRRQTSNPEAYALYLKGRYEWSQLSPAGNRRALEYYEQALEKDPQYALAWAGIAHTLATSLVTANSNPAAIVERARDAVEQALRYGPDLAEAHYAKGYFASFFEHDEAAAEAAARRAIELDPNNSLPYFTLASQLIKRGEDVEAAAAMRRAREIDPLFSQTFALSSQMALVMGDTESALEFARQAVAINPEGWVGHLHLGRAYAALGDDAAALRAATDADRFSGGNSTATADRAMLLARLGRQEEARALLRDLLAREYVSPCSLALVHESLGEVEAAFEVLERAVTERDALCVEPDRYDDLGPLRAYPAYARLIEHFHASQQAADAY